jgi:hypothetical protein
MLIRLTKISDATHRLELVRDDGTRESVALASRSFLWHDLLHYAVETNAGLRQSFWGLLAAGRTLADLPDALSEGDGATAAPTRSTEAAITEAIVGVLTGVVQERAAPRAAIEGLTRLFEAQERELPVWFSADFVERVREHMRRLIGQWRAVPFGGDMQLTFPAACDAVAGRGQPARQGASQQAVGQQKARPEGRGGLRRNRSSAPTSSRHR